MGCSLDQYPVDMHKFFTKELVAVDVQGAA